MPSSKSRSSRSSSASSAWSSTPRPSPPRRPITDTPRQGRAVQPRVAENGRVLLESYRVLARAIKDERSITPAAEWLVDNFHIVDEQLREIRDDLPAGLLPRAAQAGRGPSRRLSAGPRPRVGVRRAHRQPLRSREPAPDGARLPGGRAADDRRAVGDRDQPAHPARREPAPPRRADRAQPRGAPDGRRARRPAARPRHGQRRTTPPASLRRLVARRAPDGRRASSCSSACATRTRRVTPALALAGGAPRVAGHDRRGDGPPRAPAPGDDERDRPQRDHEHAPHLVVRLGRVRRERQPGRRGPARAGSAFGEMDFATRDRYRHADRGARPRFGPDRGRGRPRRQSAMADATHAGATTPTPSTGATSAIPATT